MTAVLVKLPPFMEFHSAELEETAVEFYREGILRAPFPVTEFETDYYTPEDIIPVDKVRLRITVEEEVPHALNAKAAVDEHPTHTVSMAVHDDSMGKDVWRAIPRVFHFTGERIRADLPEGKPKTDEELAHHTEIAKWARRVLMLCMMVCNMKEFEQEEVKISEKLNKARVKRGRPLLRDFIQIRMKSEYRAALEGNDFGSLKTPHWRRGHLRRLSSGRVVPVSPCMVNWRGEPIEPKTYRVSI